MDNNIKVTIWGKEVGRLTWDVSRKRSVFEYAPNFLKGELDIAPLTASIYDRRNRLPFYGEANNGVFYGLPAFQPTILESEERLLTSDTKTWLNLDGSLASPIRMRLSKVRQSA